MFVLSYLIYSSIFSVVYSFFSMRNIFKTEIRRDEPFQSLLLCNSGAGLDGFRLNKCLSNLSRRGADAAIAAGRVTVNGLVASCGTRVRRGDVVKFDGKLQNWSQLENIRSKSLTSVDQETRNFVYIKYWKPLDCTCTSDLSDSSNIIARGKFNLFPQRLFTVGRLDKDSTGLILITSDGRVNNALLNPSLKREKVTYPLYSPFSVFLPLF